MSGSQNVFTHLERFETYVDPLPSRELNEKINISLMWGWGCKYEAAVELAAG